MSNITDRSIQLHKKFQGKLETTVKIPVNNADDLSLAYTPGVGAVSRLIAPNPDLGLN